MSDHASALENAFIFTKSSLQSTLQSPASSRSIIREYQQRFQTLFATSVAQLRGMEIVDVEEDDRVGTSDTIDGGMPCDADEEAADEEGADGERPGKERSTSRKRKRKNDLPNRRPSSHSDQAIDRSPRLAAVDAMVTIRDHKSGGSPKKRSKRPKNGSSEPSDQVEWLLVRVGNKDALTGALDLVNNWPQLAADVLHEHVGLKSLALLPVTEPRFRGFYDFVDLGRWVSIEPVQGHAREVVRRINNAHFHWLWRAAVEDSGKDGSGTFFRMTDELLLHNGVIPQRSHDQGHKHLDAVKARFLDTIFSFPRTPGLTRKKCGENMHKSEQNGKRSARVISTLGYKGLLQLPPEVSDNRYVSNLGSSNVMLLTRAPSRSWDAD